MSGAITERLRNWRDAEAARLAGAGEPMFLGKPDAWFEKPHWLCSNGHVGHRLLKGETTGDRCLACLSPVILGPPVSEDQLGEILADLEATAHPGG